MSTVLSTAEVANMLRVPSWRIRRLFEDGELVEPARVAGRRVVPTAMLPAIIDALRNRDWLPISSERRRSPCHDRRSRKPTPLRCSSPAKPPAICSVCPGGFFTI